jgi:hypothetical protein
MRHFTTEERKQREEKLSQITENENLIVEVERNKEGNNLSREKFDQMEKAGLLNQMSAKETPLIQWTWKTQYKKQKKEFCPD